MAEGSRRYLAYVAESTWGTTPGSPSMKLLRNTGGSGARLARAQLTSAEMRSDRAISDMRLGNKTPTLDIPFEFSYTSFDDFLEGALFGTWTVAYNLTAQTVTVDAAAKTFSRASGSWITDGVQQGDRIITTGFDAAGNNGSFIVTNVVALTITCSGATGLVNVTDDTAVAVTTDRFILKQGVTPKFFTIEEGFADLVQYQNVSGCMINTMGLNVAPNAMITGSFGILGKSVSAFSGTPLDASPDSAPTTSPFDSYTGSITEGGSAIATVTGLSLNVANGLEHQFALFSADPHRIGTGRANITGSISAYFESVALANKFLAETDSSISFVLTDLAGNSYTILIPKINYTASDKSVSENNIVIDLPFQALYDSTEATALKITRKPA